MTKHRIGDIYACPHCGESIRICVGNEPFDGVWNWEHYWRELNECKHQQAIRMGGQLILNLKRSTLATTLYEGGSDE